MKKVFILALLVSLSALGFARNDVHTSVNSAGIDKLDKIQLRLDLGDLTNKSDAEIIKIVDSFVKNALQGVGNELQCSVSVTGSVSVGVVEFAVTVEVSGPCSEVKAKGKEIALYILSEVKKLIKENF